MAYALSGGVLSDPLHRLRIHEDSTYKVYFPYLNNEARIQSIIYTTNWIERLQKDLRWVTRMRGAMPNEEPVLL